MDVKLYSAPHFLWLFRQSCKRIWLWFWLLLLLYQHLCGGESEWGHLSFRRILQQLSAPSGINRSDCVTKQPMQRLYWLLNQTHRIDSFRTLFYTSLFTILTKNEPVWSMKSLLHLHFTAADSLSVSRRKSNHWDTGNTTSSALFFCEHDWHRWGLLSIKAKMGGSGDLIRCTEWKAHLTFKTLTNLTQS